MAFVPLTSWTFPRPKGRFIASEARYASASQNQVRWSMVSERSPSRERIFIYGVGYVGLHFALAMKARGAHISGATRSSSRADGLRRLGLDVVALDSCDSAGATDESSQHSIVSKLRSATHLLSTAGPDSDGDPFLNAYEEVIVDPSSQLTWIGYVSSTSVYGDHDGGWVDETSVSVSAGSKGTARLAAEAAWQNAACRSQVGARLCVFRLAGIYGPGRSAIDTLLRRPMALARNGGKESVGRKMLTSRAHIDDITGCLLAAIQDHGSEGIYNVADDVPASRDEVFGYARSLLEDGIAGKSCAERLNYLDMRLAENPDLGQRQSTRDKERVSKRVSNQRIRTELVQTLRYPSFREGLNAIAEAYIAKDT